MVRLVMSSWLLERDRPGILTVQPRPYCMKLILRELQGSKLREKCVCLMVPCTFQFVIERIVSVSMLSLQLLLLVLLVMFEINI